MNINEFLKLVAQGKGNPKQLLMKMVPQNSGLTTLIQKEDGKGLEEFARNMSKEKGLDFDEEMKKFRQQYHI